MMTTLISPTMDAQLRLEMMHLQLNWLEREMIMLRRVIGQSEATNTPHSVKSFASLRGVWAGVDVSADDFQLSRLTLSENLL